MPLTLLVYAVAIASGYAVADALALPTRLARWLVTTAAAAAQLTLSIQLLSLFRQLNGPGVIALNVILSSVTWIVAKKLIRTAHREHQPTVRSMANPDPATKFGWFEWVVGIACAAVVVIYSVIALLGYPFCDPYHFTMPLFWKEQGTIFAAPVYDPRINGVVFASEAISFPAVLFAKTGAAFVVLSSLAAGGVLWIVAAISRQLGGSTKAAICVAATLAGSSVFSLSTENGQADILLSAMWLAGSFYLLLEAYQREEGRAALIGSSAFCFAMAAGTKNVILLHAPLYGVAAILLFGRWILRFGNLSRTVLLPGLAGAVVSGLLWSYVSDYFWYGDVRGHAFIRATLSTELTLGAVWTRYCRGLVTFASDIYWAPPKYVPLYADVCQRAVHLLGGASRLKEDSGFYAFTKEQIRPGQGMGLVGPLVILPGIVAAIYGTVTRRSAQDDHTTATKCLIVFALGSILVFFATLRWQSIGVMRLMLSCSVLVLPLCTRWLESRWTRSLALIVAAVSIGMYSIWGVGLRLRRFDPTGKLALSRALEKLQRAHTTVLSFRWQGEPVQPVQIYDRIWRREMYEHVMERIPQPVVFGIVGGYNTQAYWLFGERYRNRVLPVNDCREPHAHNPAPNNVQYLIIEEFPIEHVHPEVIAGFEPWLEVEDEGSVVWRCLQRRHSELKD